MFGDEFKEEGDTVYVYEGSPISHIELDESTTTAEFFNNTKYGGVINEYDYSDLEKVFYSKGEKLLLDIEHVWKDYNAESNHSAFIKGIIGVKIYFEDGSVYYDKIDVNLEQFTMCLAEGTQITLADRTTKAIEDITYNDELLVWDFDNARFATAKPLWIMKVHTSPQYNLLKFDNGSELKTIDQHRIFNKDIGKFTYPMTDETPVGTTTFTDAGTETKLISKEVVQERVNYYNIITDYHINLFANGILTSCRLSNLYQIENMKYVKDNRKLIPKEEYPTVPQEYYEGLRLAEQPKEVNRGNDVEHSKDLAGYVQNLINKAQPKV